MADGPENNNQNANANENAQVNAQANEVDFVEEAERELSADRLKEYNDAVAELENMAEALGADDFNAAPYENALNGYRQAQPEIGANADVNNPGIVARMLCFHSVYAKVAKAAEKLEFYGDNYDLNKAFEAGEKSFNALKEKAAKNPDELERLNSAVILWYDNPAKNLVMAAIPRLESQVNDIVRDKAKLNAADAVKKLNSYYNFAAAWDEANNKLTGRADKLYRSDKVRNSINLLCDNFDIDVIMQNTEGELRNSVRLTAMRKFVNEQNEAYKKYHLAGEKAGDPAETAYFDAVKKCAVFVTKYAPEVQDKLEENVLKNANRYLPENLKTELANAIEQTKNEIAAGAQADNVPAEIVNEDEIKASMRTEAEVRADNFNAALNALEKMTQEFANGTVDAEPYIEWIRDYKEKYHDRDIAPGKNDGGVRFDAMCFYAAYMNLTSAAAALNENHEEYDMERAFSVAEKAYNALEGKWQALDAGRLGRLHHFASATELFPVSEIVKNTEAAVADFVNNDDAKQADFEELNAVYNNAAEWADFSEKLHCYNQISKNEKIKSALIKAGEKGGFDRFAAAAAGKMHDAIVPVYKTELTKRYNDAATKIGMAKANNDPVTDKMLSDFYKIASDCIKFWTAHILEDNENIKRICRTAVQYCGAEKAAPLLGMLKAAGKTEIAEDIEKEFNIPTVEANLNANEIFVEQPKPENQPDLSANDVPFEAPAEQKEELNNGDAEKQARAQAFGNALKGLEDMAKAFADGSFNGEAYNDDIKAFKAKYPNRDIKPGADENGVLFDMVCFNAAYKKVVEAAAALDENLEGYDMAEVASAVENTYGVLEGKWKAVSAERLNQLNTASILMTNPTAELVKNAEAAINEKANAIAGKDAAEQEDFDALNNAYNTASAWAELTDKVHCGNKKISTENIKDSLVKAGERLGFDVLAASGTGSMRDKLVNLGKKYYADKYKSALSTFQKAGFDNNSPAARDYYDIASDSVTYMLQFFPEDDKGVKSICRMAASRCGVEKAEPLLNALKGAGKTIIAEEIEKEFIKPQPAPEAPQEQKINEQPNANANDQHVEVNANEQPVEANANEQHVEANANGQPVEVNANANEQPVEANANEQPQAAGSDFWIGIEGADAKAHIETYISEQAEEGIKNATEKDFWASEDGAHLRVAHSMETLGQLKDIIGSGVKVPRAYAWQANHYVSMYLDYISLLDDKKNKTAEEKAEVDITKDTAFFGAVVDDITRFVKRTPAAERKNTSREMYENVDRAYNSAAERIGNRSEADLAIFKAAVKKIPGVTYALIQAAEDKAEKKAEEIASKPDASQADIDEFVKAFNAVYERNAELNPKAADYENNNDFKPEDKRVTAAVKAYDKFGEQLENSLTGVLKDKWEYLKAQIPAARYEMAFSAFKNGGYEAESPEAEKYAEAAVEYVKHTLSESDKKYSENEKSKDIDKAAKENIRSIYSDLRNNVGAEKAEPLYELIKNSGYEKLFDLIEKSKTYADAHDSARKKYGLVFDEDIETKMPAAKENAAEEDVEAFLSDLAKSYNLMLTLPGSSVKIKNDIVDMAAGALHFYSDSFLGKIDGLDGNNLASILEDKANGAALKGTAQEAADSFKYFLNLWDKTAFDDATDDRKVCIDKITEFYNEAENKFGTDFSKSVEGELLKVQKSEYGTDPRLNINHGRYEKLIEDLGTGVFFTGALDYAKEKGAQREFLKKYHELSADECLNSLVNMVILSTQLEKPHAYPDAPTDTENKLVKIFAGASEKFGEDFSTHLIQELNKTPDESKSFSKQCLDVLENDMMRREGFNIYESMFEDEEIPYIYEQALSSLINNNDPKLVDRLAKINVLASEVIGKEFTEKAEELLEGYPEVQKRSEEIKAYSVTADGHLPVDKEQFNREFAEYKKSRQPDTKHDELLTNSFAGGNADSAIGTENVSYKQLYVNRVNSALEALRKGPDGTDPMSMLKWCKDTAILAPSRLKAYADKAEEENVELPQLVTPNDIKRMVLIDRWTDVYSFPEETRDLLLECGGAANIKNKENVRSGSNNLEFALRQLDDAYDKAGIHPAGEQKKWFEHDSSKMFSYKLSEDRLNMLNIKALRNNLKALQKELKATDPFWVRNSQGFRDLKTALDSTLDTLKQYSADRGDDTKDKEKKLNFYEVLKSTEKLADTAKKYYTKKAADYKASNNDREKTRATAASKIYAFAGSYSLRERTNMATRSINEFTSFSGDELKNVFNAVEDSKKYSDLVSSQKDLSVLCKYVSAHANENELKEGYDAKAAELVKGLKNRTADDAETKRAIEGIKGEFNRLAEAGKVIVDEQLHANEVNNNVPVGQQANELNNNVQPGQQNEEIKNPELQNLIPNT